MITNKSCIIRLSRYKNSLYRLRALGFVKVFSDNLADAIGVLPSQVRKDFSLFGISGNKRGGYQVDTLIEKLNTILGKEQVQEVIVAGLGNIGNALMKYKGFEKEGIKICACFDIDSAKYHRDAAIPVLPLEEMKDFVRNKRIKIGVIAVPDIAAQSVLDMMLACGIKGVLNFAPLRLRAPDDIVVNNVNLELELENVIYFVNTQGKTKSG
ncbi:MAG: redox-sensing transcriptional repressor Rex [Candidatus Omnitrophica bacterium]|nr:redox-sensing transcriptional repressor Rex [Candidatus Omnitrophota bacterium]